MAIVISKSQDKSTNAVIIPLKMSIPFDKLIRDTFAFGLWLIIGNKRIATTKQQQNDYNFIATLFLLSFEYPFPILECSRLPRKKSSTFSHEKKTASNKKPLMNMNIKIEIKQKCTLFSWLWINIENGNILFKRDNRFDIKWWKYKYHWMKAACANFAVNVNLFNMESISIAKETMWTISKRFSRNDNGSLYFFIRLLFNCQICIRLEKNAW